MKGAMKLMLVVSLATGTMLACSGQEGARPSSETASRPAEDWREGLDPEIVDALSQLGDADRAAVLAQKTCPVSGKPLGTMGVPYKVTVEETNVFLCCDGCEEELRKNASEYLAKLKSD